jgi:hypothetical protein
MTGSDIVRAIAQALAADIGWRGPFQGDSA